ncbi:FkbM family methyltransferase [Synechococcus sp. A15-62]|uniref:FkbM family methyltransferase n=1 Tax=Synechococcus sp. A15-62 TaxID=1050657 RepID=UPI001644759D|nr:FkbM family methyltransferase [Synechococcus sp. A15-62]
MKGTKVSSKNSFLKRYLDSGNKINTVFDVGVNERTQELINLFPDALHYLFEPSTIYNEKIYTYYASINHSLHNIALADKNEITYIIETSLKKDGVITHARMSPHYIEPNGLSIVRCSEVEIKRLDSMFDAIPANSLLKIDTDGSDLLVLKGCGDLLQSFSIILVEAALHKFSETVSFLEEKGFAFRDMVDRCYYHERLWQADLVFFPVDAIPDGWDHNPSVNFKREAYIECD